MRDSHAQQMIADVRYNVGIKSLDNQHQSILITLDRLFTAVELNQDREKIVSIISDFLTQARQHFSKEEELMKGAEFPSFSVHKQSHDGYINKILIYQKNMIDGNISFAIERVAYFRRWFKDHILETDKQYIPFFSTRGIV